ncbi:hypothetical protein Plhal304r1_c022g0077831 [Plasmopara halstedii]
MTCGSKKRSRNFFTLVPKLSVIRKALHISADVAETSNGLNHNYDVIILNSQINFLTFVFILAFLVIIEWIRLCIRLMHDCEKVMDMVFYCESQLVTFCSARD